MNQESELDDIWPPPGSSSRILRRLAGVGLVVTGLVGVGALAVATLKASFSSVASESPMGLNVDHTAPTDATAERDPVIDTEAQEVIANQAVSDASVGTQQVEIVLVENSDDAQTDGVFGTASLDDTQLDGVFGNSALDSNLTDGIGGLISAKGTQMDTDGLDSRDSDLSGGGAAQSGEGGIGRIGGDPIILGALDQALIDAVITTHMNQIRYCYQRELNNHPSLGGKIVIKFVVAKDGSVSRASVKSSTMGSAVVENCIAGRFMRFTFPEPKGGSIVIVSYPFIFAPN